MLRNDNVNNIFKNRMGMEDRKVGMKGILGKVCMGMLGSVGECNGMMENIGIVGKHMPGNVKEY